MAFIKNSIALKVSNNTNFKAKIPLMGVNNHIEQVNSNLLYTFDLSTETFIGVFSVQLFVSTNTNPTLQFFEIFATNIDSVKRVVDLLNTFNVGLFNFDGNIIFITSNFNIYDRITLT